MLYTFNRFLFYGSFGVLTIIVLETISQTNPPIVNWDTAPLGSLGMCKVKQHYLTRSNKLVILTPTNNINSQILEYLLCVMLYHGGIFMSTELFPEFNSLALWFNLAWWKHSAIKFLKKYFLYYISYTAHVEHRDEIFTMSMTPHLYLYIDKLGFFL